MNQLDKTSYTVFLSSNDKVGGSNNNANYQVNWDNILPRKINKYKLVYSFQTAGGYYKDNYSQFQISAIGTIITPSFSCTLAPIYNASTGYLSLIVTTVTGVLYANNYVTIVGSNYNIIQGVSGTGQTLIISGNPAGYSGITYYGGPYTSVTANTVTNYSGSVSIGQTINYNTSTFLILNVTLFNTNSTNIILKGTPTTSLLPINTTLYASNNTTYNGCKVVINLGSQSTSFDTANLSQSYTLGYGFRDIQTSTSNSNCLSTFYMQNPPKTINIPNQNIINIQIFNNSNVYNSTTGNLQSNQLLTNTDYFSNPTSDMSSYSMILEFIPISNEIEI
jgi:hypothetical protein